MTRFSAVLLLLMLIGCADQSKGTALNECRLKYYLEGPVAQGELIPDCMTAKSFPMTTSCDPVADEREWDWQVRTYAYDNPKCYRSAGSTPAIATLLSPM